MPEAQRRVLRWRFGRAGVNSAGAAGFADWRGCGCGGEWGGEERKVHKCVWFRLARAGSVAKV